MSIKRVVPDITSARMEESRKFYTEFLDFDVAMDMGWIVTLVSRDNPTAQITLLRDTATTAPRPELSIEVADVDAAHARASVLNLEIVYPLTDEPWACRGRVNRLEAARGVSFTASSRRVEGNRCWER